MVFNRNTDLQDSFVYYQASHNFFLCLVTFHVYFGRPKFKLNQSVVLIGISSLISVNKKYTYGKFSYHFLFIYVVSRSFSE